MSDQLLHLRLRHLQLVELLAQHGTVGQIAEEMNRTQPALTKMLQELEASLGTRLFERGRHGAKITPEGAAFARRAAIILNEWRQIPADIEVAKRSGGTVLRVGSTPLIGMTILPGALSGFRKEYPNVRVTLREASMHELISALEAGEIDLIVGRYSGEGERRHPYGQLVQERLYDEHLVAIAGALHPLAQMRGLSWDYLAAADWVLPPPELTTRRLFEMEFLRAGKSPPVPVFETTSFATAISFVARGEVLGLVPEVAAQFAAELGLVTKLDCMLDTFSAPVSTLRRASVPESPDMARFCASLRVSCQSYADGIGSE
ncbi:LysR substrate-binding domain-containing protein [Sinisalibacter aestuarii]|uniref:LysR family transcriptional regulator n=1 Tax=Sinisalibacter aestuarii TaxID=2949426 RepID=A0ABQ5LYU8_9RHOB|nr:LysR substrate-binding domain-containing protein [Sinisalibacter aestuarii]GKY90136.1 LysR family transcriptional regulator [Sinisalibacter aestuarii]